MARRYRVRFNANFTLKIEAEDAEDARKIADQLVSNPAMLPQPHEELHVAWSTITPLTPHGTEVEHDD